MKLFSVIIPTYNRGNLIAKTIESLLNQTYLNFEILIVDDGSTDNTSEIVAPFLSSKVKYFRKENSERGATRNYGTKLASGDYINWFDSDDIAYPNHLSEAELFSGKLNNSEIFHLSFQYNKPDGSLFRSAEHFPEADNPILYLGNNLSCNGVFVRRDVALRNLFNEDRKISASEDYDLWLRLAAQYPIYCSNTITSSIIQHEERSVLTMRNSATLITRYTLFLNYINSNKQVVDFLGKQLKNFNMRNYLILSADLAANKHKRDAIRFLIKGCKCSYGFWKLKVFYAILKHLLT